MSHQHTIRLVNDNQTGLEAVFSRFNDRYSHQIKLIGTEADYVCLASCEGTSDQDWPPCPPLQQIHQQDIGDTPALLGVGMSGSNHWSSSFHLVDRDNPRLICEHACRTHAHKTEIAEIGSVYGLNSDCDWSENNGFLSCSIENWKNRIELYGGQIGTVLSLSVDRSSVQLKPNLDEEGTEPPRLPSNTQVSGLTIQWKYEIKIVQI